MVIACSYVFVLAFCVQYYVRYKLSLFSQISRWAKALMTHSVKLRVFKTTSHKSYCLFQAQIFKENHNFAMPFQY